RYALAVRTAAILPVKRFAVAKQRLGSSMAHSPRARLAAAMVADVLEALAAARSIERIIVVTRERSLAAEAERHRAIVLEDPAELRPWQLRAPPLPRAGGRRGVARRAPALAAARRRHRR